MATPQQQQQLIALTTMLFNAPPGAKYLAELEAQLDAGASLEQVAVNLTNTPLFNSQFGGLDSDKAKIDLVLSAVGIDEQSAAYQEAYGFFATSLANGVSPGAALQEAANFLSSTQDEAFSQPSAMFRNKVDAGVKHTIELGLTSENLDELKGAVEGITDDPETLAQKEQQLEEQAQQEQEDQPEEEQPEEEQPTDGDVVVGNMTINIASQNGERVTVAGDVGNDVFTAKSSAALTNNLTLAGGDGNDTLKATVDSVLTTSAMPTINGVETFELTSTGKNSGLLFSRVADVQKIVNVASTQTLQALDIDVTGTVGLAAKDISSANTVESDALNFIVRYSAQKVDASQSLELSDAHLNLVTVTALNSDLSPKQSGITELNIVSNGAANTVRTFNENDADGTSVGLQGTLKTITISGAADFTTVQLPENITVDGSEATGVLNLIVSSGSTITGGSAGDIFNASTDGVTTFKYTDQAQSTASASDKIIGFTGGENGDKIDLTAVLATNVVDDSLVNQAQVGGSPVSWVEVEGNTIVTVDVNGDAANDMQITLVGINLGLTDASFVGVALDLVG